MSFFEETTSSGISENNNIDLRERYSHREELIHIAMQAIDTSFSCYTIKIGSYSYTPKEEVYISSNGIKIVAPSVKHKSKEVALQIQLEDIVRIPVHFGKEQPLIFLYTNTKCGEYIRKALDMANESGPYYNPISSNPYRKITFLFETFTDSLTIAFKTLFGKVIDIVTHQEAIDMLSRTCTEEGNNITKITTSSASSSGAKISTPAEIRPILIYPPGKSGIPIFTEDYMCLAQDQFLNDVIIDFYLTYLFHDVLTPSQREKTYIFSTFFYKRLTSKPSEVNKSTNSHEWGSNLTAQKRHVQVKKWTKNVNIFEKDFVVVPINEDCHWFVAIICWPSLDGCRSMMNNSIVNPQSYPKTVPIKQASILIFDSLAVTSRFQVISVLRDYLTSEYQAKFSQDKIFSKENIKASCPKVPQQNNFTDCGLYLLQYVEQFFRVPILDYALPIMQLANWFDEIIVIRKREDISNLLKLMLNKYNPDSLLALPNVAFPTLNGKLVKTEDEVKSLSESSMVDSLLGPIMMKSLPGSVEMVSLLGSTQMDSPSGSSEKDSN